MFVLVEQTDCIPTKALIGEKETLVTELEKDLKEIIPEMFDISLEEDLKIVDDVPVNVLTRSVAKWLVDNLNKSDDYDFEYVPREMKACVKNLKYNSCWGAKILEIRE